MPTHVPEFGTPVLVRAEIVRVVGEHTEDGFHYRQKPLDAKRYAKRDFGDVDAWPGHAIPEDWAETPEWFDIDAIPNGHALTRCRRIILPMASAGLVVGKALVAEGMLAEAPRARGGRFHSLVDRRNHHFWEVAMPPGGSGRTRLALVHPHDATLLPLSTSMIASAS